MELNKEDNVKLVNIEMSLEEVNLLKELLKLETVLQIRDQIAANDELNSKVYKVVTVFDHFREFDDKLLDLILAISEQDKKAIKQGFSPKNIVVINRNLAKIYRMLCTETVKGGLPDYLKGKYEMLGLNLINKIEHALNSDIKKLELKSENPDLNINILGVKGLA